MPYFQLPSLSFLRRRESDVDLETLFIHSEREKNAMMTQERLAENPVEKNVDSPKKQEQNILPQEKTYRPEELSAENLNTFAEYGKRVSDIRSQAGEHRFFQTAAKENIAFSDTGTAQAEENFSAEQFSHNPQENTMPEKKSEAQLSVAISALTECARGQLRYLKKNYDLLKTQTEERYFN